MNSVRFFSVIISVLAFATLVQAQQSVQAQVGSAPAPGVTYLSRNGSARATAYGMNPMIVTKNGKTHIAYLNWQESIVVRSRNDSTNTWSPPYLIGTGEDNHGAPALVSDSQGFLHILFGPHHGQFRYRRSVRPNDMSAWTPTEYVGTSGTYASMVVDQHDTLHVVYRGGYDSGELTYLTRSKDGVWSNARALVDGTATGHHVSYNDMIAIGGDQSLHICYNFFAGWLGGKGEKVGYMRSTDLGKTWQDYQGKEQHLPVTFRTAPSLGSNEDSDYRANWVAADPAGNGYVAITDVAQSPRFQVVKLGRDGTITRTDLSNSFPTGELYDTGSVPSVSPDNKLWIAATHAPLQGGGWASPKTAISIFKIDLNHFEDRVVYNAGQVPYLRTPGATRASDTQPTWLPSFERFTGHNDQAKVPKLMFTSGPANNANTLGTGQRTRIFFVDMKTYLYSKKK